MIRIARLRKSASRWYLRIANISTLSMQLVFHRKNLTRLMWRDMARRWNKYHIAHLHDDRSTMRTPVSGCTVGQCSGWKCTRERERASIAFLRPMTIPPPLSPASTFPATWTWILHNVANNPSTRSRKSVHAGIINAHRNIKCRLFIVLKHN